VLENTRSEKRPLNINWIDYALLSLLAVPIILAFVYGEFHDFVGYILVSIVGLTPPIIYLDARRLADSRKSAFGWAFGSLLLWIVLVPVYIFSKRKELKRARQ
jgi:uncharacterized membrane protein YhaH (DUF805 family)